VTLRVSGGPRTLIVGDKINAQDLDCGPVPNNAMVISSEQVGYVETGLIFADGGCVPKKILGKVHS
jgi:hypothetical protein